MLQCSKQINEHEHKGSIWCSFKCIWQGSPQKAFIDSLGFGLGVVVFGGLRDRQNDLAASMFSTADQSYQSNPTGMPGLQSASEKAMNSDKNMNKCNPAFSIVQINLRSTEGSTDVSTGIQSNIQIWIDEVWVLSLGKQLKVPKGTTKWEIRHLERQHHSHPEDTQRNHIYPCQTATYTEN